MKAYISSVIVLLSLFALCGITTSSAQSPTCRARTPDLRAVDLLNVDRNYWGGFDPYLGTSGCTDCFWDGSGTIVSAQTWSGTLSYTATVGAASLIWIAPPDVSCGDGWGGAVPRKPVQNRTMSVTEDSSKACTQMYLSGYLLGRNSQWQGALDTLKRFVETCPLNPSSPSAFPQLGGAMGHLDHGDSLFRDGYLKWLESVLYLNTIQPEYFCACVQQIAGALPYPVDNAPGNVSRNTNMSLSVIHWLLLNTTCDTPSLWLAYHQTRTDQRRQWANNPNAYVLDTTLPPLSKWGLDTVLAKHFQYALVKGGPDNFSRIVNSYNVTKNPTDGATELRFTLGSDAYVNVEVHDVLGRLVSGDAVGKILSVGDHRVSIDISNYPAGTYYLSITLGTGEVRTVKLVKK